MSSASSEVLKTAVAAFGAMVFLESQREMAPTPYNRISRWSLCGLRNLSIEVAERDKYL